jgi:aminoglycoside 6'-N-acetyltransferase I
MHQVRRACHRDRFQLAQMRAMLWPDGSSEDHLAEVDAELASGMNGTLPMAIFVAQGDDGNLLGFVEVGLRSHADGCAPAHPVGFIEGWFVREEYRKQGIGRDLMLAAEEWTRTQRCREIASDALIDSRPSLDAHQALGFEIVDRCVHFRKSLERNSECFGPTPRP